MNERGTQEEWELWEYMGCCVTFNLQQHHVASLHKNAERYAAFLLDRAKSVYTESIEVFKGMLMSC